MPDLETLTGIARTEIEELHVFFDDWFGGLIKAGDSVFDGRFSARFDPECILIQPGGVSLDYNQFKEGVRSGYASSPGFKVEIRNVTVRLLTVGENNAHDILLVTYEEWQKNAINSTPPNNGRAASVIFKIVRNDPIKLHWYHIHETWLPKSVMDADNFDF